MIHKPKLGGGSLGADRGLQPRCRDSDRGAGGVVGGVGVGHGYDLAPVGAGREDVHDLAHARRGQLCEVDAGGERQVPVVEPGVRPRYRWHWPIRLDRRVIEAARSAQTASRSLIHAMVDAEFRAAAEPRKVRRVSAATSAPAVNRRGGFADEHLLKRR